LNILFRPGAIINTRLRLISILLVSVGLRGVAVASDPSLTYGFHHDYVLGTSLDLVVATDSAEKAEAIEEAVLKTIDRLCKVLSTYDSSSQISRFNRSTVSMHASTSLIDVLSACETWRRRTGGAFSCNVGALMRLWNSSAKVGKSPDASSIQQAVREGQSPAFEIDRESRTITRVGSAIVNPNALAKGYIIDRAFEAARAVSPELRGILIDIGGDIYAWQSEKGTGQKPWHILIADPKKSADNDAPAISILVARRAVATSASYARTWQIAGKAYSHIIDPRTGRPIDQVVSATVVADDAMTADALATSLNVLSVRDGLKLVNAMGSVECMITTRDGTRSFSRQWEGLVAPGSVFFAATSATKWAAGHQLKIVIKLARPKSRKYRRPYVVVWITDASGKSVRTLSLWRRKSKKTKYLNSLKVWWSIGKKHTSRIDSFSRATRNPGEYTLAWDGTDDNGKALAPGDYTVHVESAREHGSHVHMRESIHCGTTNSAKQSIVGNKEIDAVKLTYGKKP
jgi:thiamine biosynthesis lipoprotein